MEHLWAPWRSSYITSAKHAGDCVFCRAARGNDEEALVVHRAAGNFVMLNRYPYSSGHLMIAPYDHVNRLSVLSQTAAEEMMALAQQAQSLLEQIYNPGGINIGMNMGTAAGAGIEEHIHLHVLPRWSGDANFMTVIGDTRVMPESLEETFAKLKGRFAR